MQAHTGDAAEVREWEEMHATGKCACTRCNPISSGFSCVLGSEASGGADLVVGKARALDVYSKLLPTVVNSHDIGTSEAAIGFLDFLLSK